MSQTGLFWNALSDFPTFFLMRKLIYLPLIKQHKSIISWQTAPSILMSHFCLYLIYWQSILAELQHMNMTYNVWAQYKFRSMHTWYRLVRRLVRRLRTRFWSKHRLESPAVARETSRRSVELSRPVSLCGVQLSIIFTITRTDRYDIDVYREYSDINWCDCRTLPPLCPFKTFLVGKLWKIKAVQMKMTVNRIRVVVLGSPRSGKSGQY